MRVLQPKTNPLRVKTKESRTNVHTEQRKIEPKKGKFNFLFLYNTEHKSKGYKQLNNQ